MRHTLPEVLYGGALLTISLVGVGVVQYFFGHDLGSGLQPSWVFLALALLAVFISGMVAKDWLGPIGRKWGREFLKLPTSWIILGSLLVVVISGLGIIIAPSFEPQGSSMWRLGRQFIQLLIMLFFLGWAGIWTRGCQRWRFTLDLLFLGVCFQILYGVFQEINFYYPQVWFSHFENLFTSNPSILSGSEKLYLNNSLQDIPRLRGTLCEPLYLGNFLLMVWPFLINWRRSRILRLGLAMAMAFLLLLTWSRGAWLGALGQLILLGIFYSARIDRQKLWFKNKPHQLILNIAVVIVLFLVIILMMFFLGEGIVFQRLLATFNNQDWSNLTRLYSMKAAWAAFLESPLVGIGWGQFAFHFPLLVEPMGLQSQFSWPVVNNFPLMILCETGLVGFLFFVGTFGYLIRKSWSHILGDSHQRLSHPMVMPAILANVGVWIQLLTFSQYNLPHIWVALGLLLAALADNSCLGATSETKARV